jgi:hypothetical protein
MERVFAAHRVKIHTSMEMASNESIKQAVIAGLGMGFLSLYTVRSELAWGGLALLDVEGLPVQRQWYAVRRASRRLVPAAVEFGTFLEREAAALINAEGNLMDVLRGGANGMKRAEREEPGSGKRRRKSLAGRKGTRG